MSRFSARACARNLPLHRLAEHPDAWVRFDLVTVERRIPKEAPVDAETTAELRAADILARLEAAERSQELLERLRKI